MAKTTQKVSEKKEEETTKISDTKEEQQQEVEVTAKVEEKEKKPKKEKKPSVDFEAQFKEIQDKYLRLSADFDNYRKRTLKEKIELTKNAGEEIFTQLLPVLDDFERAMDHINQAKDLDAVKEGIELIYTKFKEYLNQQGIKEIEAMHQEFNTDVHEAISKIPVTEKKLKGKIVDVIEKGYFLNDKVIRYAKVVIGE